MTVPPDDRPASPNADDRMTELRQLFFETAAELIQNLNDQAMRLERSPGDAEVARSLRRTIHTLKGDAAACGYRELSELAHQFEDVLTLEGASAAAIPEISLRAADVFNALLDAYRNGTKLPSVQSLRTDIARLAHGKADSLEQEKKEERKPEAKPCRWSEYEQLAITHALAQGKRVHHVRVEINPQCGMPIAARQMIQMALADLGEVLALYPVEASPEATTNIEAALASEQPAEKVRAKCSIPTIALEVWVAPMRTQSFGSESSDTQENSVVPSASGTGSKDTTHEDAFAATAEGTVAAHEKDAPAPSDRPATPAAPDTLLRVDAERIDSVLNLVGELILAKSMLQQTLLEFAERYPKDALRGKFSDAMAFQGRVLNELQTSVMKIRMVPVDQLFRRFPRIVRDVALHCGKEVELVVRGVQTDLDKSILDALAEPLTHLVRNAIGHGIETAAERTAAGKHPQGTLRLSAYHQGNQVVIEISDDGRGIDAEKVRQRAQAQGLLNSERASQLSETETLDLILQPGFSTAEKVTELSGRGVGLDVVQSVLSRLKGTIQIETARGRGSTFRLRLPLTLAIIRALMFRVEQRLYALPLNAVAEIARTVEANVHQVEHYDVLQLRNDVLPLLRLGSKPPSGPESAQRKIFVLVISGGGRKFGLVVDGLAGEGELVIKALDDHSITTDLVSGASILGDGRVVLILNMIALADRFARGRADANGPRMAGLLSGIAPSQSKIESSAVRARGMAGGTA